MSEIDESAQASGDPEVVEPVLTFGERLLVGTNFWTIFVIVAIAIVKESSYWASGSFGESVVGWLFLCVLIFGSPFLWRFVKRGRIRAGIALGFFVLFHVFYWMPNGFVVELEGWNNTKFSEANKEVWSCGLMIK